MRNVPYSVEMVCQSPEPAEKHRALPLTSVVPRPTYAKLPAVPVEAGPVAQPPLPVPGAWICECRLVVSVTVKHVAMPRRTMRFSVNIRSTPRSQKERRALVVESGDIVSLRG